MAHGGKRKGAGRPKGRVTQAKRNLMEMAKDHGETALGVLVEIATSKSSGEAARVSAANALLDRGYGKPTQVQDHMSSDGSMSQKPTTVNLVAPKIDDGG